MSPGAGRAGGGEAECWALLESWRGLFEMEKEKSHLRGGWT